MAETAGDEAGSYALLVTPGGVQVAFSEHPNDTGYVAELGLEQFELTRVLAANGAVERFTLSDNMAGETLSFLPSGASGEYTLRSVVQTANGSNTTFSYEPVPGGSGTRIVRMLAPLPPGVICADPLQRGCRALEFDYAAATGGGDFKDRLKAVRLRAWDPATRNGERHRGALRVRRVGPPGGCVGSSDLARAEDAVRLRRRQSARAVTPPGEKPWTLSYRAAATDPDSGRLRTVSRQALPPATGSATRIVVYGVPVNGAPGAPDLSAAQLDNTGQVDAPVEGTAVFRPDDVPSDPPASYAAATVSYVNGDGRVVNEAQPGSRVSTTEYDERGNVVRELTAANRDRALQLPSTAERANRARELSTLRTWETNDAGPRLLQELGPAHAIRLSTGAAVTGRRRTITAYDQGRPDLTKNHNLPTRTTVDALVGVTGYDARVRETRYDFERRLPTEEIVDPGGLGLRTVTQYDANGLVTERRLPRHPDSGAADTTQIVRYTAGSNSVPACGSRPEWAGLPCLQRPAAQPATTADRPALPSSSFTYNLLGQPTTTTDSTPAGSRVTTKIYDAAGRPVEQRVTGTPGADVPIVQWEYSASSGKAIRTKGISGTTTRIVERGFDELGRQTSYSDAHGAATTTTFDLLVRPVVVANAAGSQTLTYSPTTGMLARVTDSDLGVITPSYDADFKIISELFETAGLGSTRRTTRARPKPAGRTSRRAARADAPGSIPGRGGRPRQLRRRTPAR